MIKQGDVFWLDLEPAKGSEPGFRRPVVVVQSNKFNKSAINTIVVCALTTNLTRAEAPGNVLLKKGIAGLKKDSVANVSQIFTINKQDLSEHIGNVTNLQLDEILSGIRLLLEP